MGRFSLPGGVVQVGETLEEAVARELQEEVGVKADVIAFNRHVQPIERERARIRTHFVIASFVARWTAGEAHASEEMDVVAWIKPEACASLVTTPGLGDIVASAARIESHLR